MGAQAEELNASVAYFKLNGSAETSHTTQGTMKIGHKPENGSGRHKGVDKLSLHHAQLKTLPQVRAGDADWQEF